MGVSALERLRRVCLALPEAVEVETWETPTFRVRGKIFAMAHRHQRGLAAWMKAPKGTQELLVEVDPARFFRPPYVGPKGWIGVVLAGRVDWAEVEELVRRSFSLVAPRELVRGVG